MTSTEDLPAHVQEALDALSVPPAVLTSGHDVVMELHRAGLLAGDRDCTCNRTEDGDRLVTHQRGDVDFCRDTFEPLAPGNA